MSSISFGDENSGLQVGISNGPITTHFHHPSYRPETAPSAVSTVPFSPDPDFVCRRTLLDQIDERFSNSASRVAFVGLGGVGKSKLAIEYTHNIRAKSPETWVFWVHASNLERYEQSFRDIAHRAKISGYQDPTANVFELVCDWLLGNPTREWIFVLDNLDDDAFLRDPSLLSGARAGVSRQPLLAFLPRSTGSNGKVIITSRCKDVALRLVDERDLISVEPMDEVDSLELFQKKIGHTDAGDDGDDASKLLDVLEYMPLAIVQAAAYIKRRAPRCTVAKYLEEFQKSEHKKVKFLEFEAGHFYRDWEAKNSILTTWGISFDHIRLVRPSAADLLSLMSFFDPQGIPEYVLRCRPEMEACDDDDADSLDDAFEADIQTLRDYLFISVLGTSQSTFQIHHLVQLATRTWLETHNQLEDWKAQSIENLSIEFPAYEDENYGKCTVLFPHARAALVQQPTANDALDKWSTLLCNAATYAVGMMHHITDAENMAEKAVETRKSFFGPHSPSTLSSMINLVFVYGQQNRLDETATLGKQVLHRCTKVLGQDDERTIVSMANLAAAYAKQGRMQEGQDLLIRAFEIQRNQRNPTVNLQLLDHRSNLAAIYLNQNQLERAENLENQTLDFKTQHLGPQHPSTLRSVSTLAQILVSQGRLEEAQSLQEQTFHIVRKVFSSKHTFTLRCQASLVSIYLDQHQHRKAEEVQIQVVEILSRLFSPEHPETLREKCDLAGIYMMQGRLREAKVLGTKALRTQVEVLGGDHTDVARSKWLLAMTYQRLRRRRNMRYLCRWFWMRIREYGIGFFRLGRRGFWKIWTSTGGTEEV